MKQLVMGVAVAAALGFVAVPASAQEGGAATTATKPLKVGLVFDVGGLGDKSFNDSAYAGLTKAQKELGVLGEYREPGEGAHREAHLRNFARGDTALIIGVGFLFTDEITNLARDFTDKKFACVDYTVTDEEMPPNLAAMTFREEEGSFLVGAIAALKSKTGQVGFVGGVESALINKFEAGFAQGARHVRPDVKVKAVYAGVSDTAFKDPQKGKELAANLYESGCDVIFHASGSTGLGVFKAAEERGKMAIGVDCDQTGDAAPGVVITSMLKSTEAAVYNVVRQTAEGKFRSGEQSIGLKEGGIGYVYSDANRDLIGPDIHAKVEDLKQQIIDGKIKVATRPGK